MGSTEPAMQVKIEHGALAGQTVSLCFKAGSVRIGRMSIEDGHLDLTLSAEVEDVSLVGATEDEAGVPEGVSPSPEPLSLELAEEPEEKPDGLEEAVDDEAVRSPEANLLQEETLPLENLPLTETDNKIDLNETETMNQVTPASASEDVAEPVSMDSGLSHETPDSVQDDVRYGEPKEDVEWAATLEAPEASLPDTSDTTEEPLFDETIPALPATGIYDPDLLNEKPSIRDIQPTAPASPVSNPTEAKDELDSAVPSIEEEHAPVVAPAPKKSDTQTLRKIVQSNARVKENYIRFTCRRCGTVGHMKASGVGSVVTCKNCGKAMRLTVKRT